MRIRIRRVAVVGLSLLVIIGLAAAIAVPAGAADDPAVVRVTLLQVNDVYEIAAVGDGTRGGLARLATIRRELQRRNPNTYAILAGDLFSPSALGTARVDGKPLDGRPIVDVMNAVGLDYATFGNHEFDLAEAEFSQRLAESHATWFSSNVRRADHRPFPDVPANVRLAATNPAGASVRVGLFGLTLDSNQREYVAYQDFKEAAREQVAALAGHVDVLIAVTHLPWEHDRDLVVAFPEIDLVLGGHEHENIQTWRGPRLTPIFKADANARTVYVHDLYYDTRTRKLTIESRLRRVDADVPEDPDVAARVARWVQAAFDAFRRDGFEPTRPVARVPEALDGTEASVRRTATRLTDLIAAGMRQAVPGADLAVFNSGSIRIDDVLDPGVITEYDIIRTLPFGGKVMTAQVKGSLLQKVLEAGEAQRGQGGYLQTTNVTRDRLTKTWQVGGAAIDPARTYRVAINDYLLSGRQTGLEFLTRRHPDLAVVETGREPDIRQTLIAELKRAYR
jgi:5'-nucleotidase/UDP-sugar diphosphatase